MHTRNFLDGMRAAKGLSIALGNGWEDVASVETAHEWAGQFVPARITHEWHAGFKTGLSSQGYGHLYQDS